MTEPTPEDDPKNYKDGYWRCGRADDCALAAGWGTDHTGVGACKLHGGNAGAPEGNQNAATHGAWSDSFVTDFLTDKEIERVKQAEDLLGTPETAQEVARTAAAIALEQFRRTGDDRFLRRYESISDTFGLAPADELEVSGDLTHSGDFDVTITNEIIETDGDE